MQFTFLVEYETPNGALKARFTNEKHAKAFVKNYKKENLGAVKLFTLNSDGTVGKEVRGNEQRKALKVSA